MGYRVIFLANPIKLSVKNEQLIIDNGEISSVPLEDIECVVADNRQITFSTHLLSRLAEHGITLYVSDSKHLPTGVFLPILKHSRHFSVLKEQINMSLPTKKQLWKQIICKKTENQATVLKLCMIDGWEEIDAIKHRVKSGDPDNMEAVAASKYFKLLFGKDFTRSQENTVNALLNYGYAILRSTIAKYLVAYGYEPSLGLFHKSTLNPFNLADDIIEPFRPLVDLWVKQHFEDAEEITTMHKAQLANLLSADVLMDGKHFAASRAIDTTVQSLTGYINKSRKELLLPSIIKPNRHSYE